MKKQTEDLQSAIAELAAIEVSSLMKRPEAWGPYNFEVTRPHLEDIREIAAVVKGLEFSKIPSFARQDIERSFIQALGTVRRINAFSVEHNQNPRDQHSSLINEAQSSAHDLQQRLHTWIPYIAYMHGDMPAKLAAIADAVASTDEHTTSFRAAIEQRMGELDETLKAAREAAAQAGVIHFAVDFQNDATSRDTEARTWLIASASFSLVSLVAAALSFFIPFPSDPVKAVQFATSKVVILALLIGITAWCAGNFKANKHQAVVSRRKAHALKTFQAFVHSSDNPSVRDAVLLETTRSIFSHAHTGYIKADGSAESASHVVEIIKSGSSEQR